MNMTELGDRFFDGPDCYTWRPVFAWWPVKTIGGRYVWLRRIYKQRFWMAWHIGTGNNPVEGFHMEPEVEYAADLFEILSDDIKNR